MMKLKRILNKAIEELDILEEYYKNQYVTTIKYVKKEIDQYKYGLAIYKFLCGRIHNEEDPKCMSKSEKKFINEELIIMEEDDNGGVQYKLNNQEKYIGKYEIDPVIGKEIIVV